MEIFLENISFLENNRAILKDVTLKIREAKTTVIIGPNGAGKTTLLRLVALLARSSSGKIYYAGKSLEGFQPDGLLSLRRKIGYIFQENLFFNDTVLANLLYPLSVRKINCEMNKIDALLYKLGLAGKKELPARVLSGGEKKRLQLARVLLFDPEIFVFDEPMSGLDPLSSEIVQNLQKELSHRQKTLLISTHNLLAARLFSDEIVFLRQGEILQTGNPEEVFLRPLSEDLAEFTDAGNIIRGEIKIEGGNTFLQAGALRINIVTERVSGNMAAVIRPEEIIISRIPIHSSAKNCISGKITGIKELGKVSFVETLCDRSTLKVLITGQSLSGMGLKIDEIVYLVFKAVAVHLIPGN